MTSIPNQHSKGIVTPRSKDKIISDLKWVRESPPIFVERLKDDQAIFDRIDSADLDASSILIDDAKWSSGRIGRYFEDLFYSLIVNSKECQKASKNVVVKNQKLTVGEFDCLVEYSDQIVHFEVAVKFFLKAEIDGVLDFWGPRKRDSLQNKIKHIREKQLRIPLPEIWAERLRESKKRFVRLAIVKGVLFYPWVEFESKTFSFTSDVQPNHLKGWWLHAHELRRIVRDDIEIVLPTKLNWLSFGAMSDAKKVRIDELAHIVNSDAPFSENYEDALMVVRIDSNGHEIDRGFIVRDLW